MKVLFITDWNTLGGATRALVGLIKELQKKDVEIIVCTGTRSNELHDKLDLLNVPYVISKHPYAMYTEPHGRLIKIRRVLMYNIRKRIALHKIERTIDLSAIDVIHTNSARSDIGVFLAKKYNIPHVIHLREFGKEDYDCEYLYKKYPRVINGSTKWFVAVSNAVKQKWVSEGIDASKIKIVYDGVSNCPYPIKEKNDNVIKFVICGAICETKGQIEALKAFKLLTEKGYNNMKLFVVGWYKQDYYKLIREYIENNNLENDILIVEKVDDVYKILQDMDVGLMCSKSEGFGLVTAEYMHAGLGVIASDRGANPELIQNNINGLLYEKGNVESLASKMELFINDRDFLHSCGVEARKRATDNFTININANRIYDIYINELGIKN